MVLALAGCASELGEEERAQARVEFFMTHGTGGNIVYDEEDPRQPIITLEFPLGAAVLDAGLRPVGKLKRLRTLNLPGADRLTDRGIQFLKGLTTLETLDLSAIGISAAGVEPLQGLNRLQSLSLMANPQIGDAGLKHLAGLRTLCRLNVAAAGVTDAGLEHLLELKELKELDLSKNPQITDKGLKKLRGLKQLQSLKVVETAVTQDGIKNLKAVLPQLTIMRSESP